MALEAGTRLGAYEVLSAIGAGGMGEVYRARDTRLKRDVAIKVLPDGFATDPDRLARFHREAELLASLNHPNIAAIYGFEEVRRGGSSDPPVTAIVLELIEGDTLADLIARGPLMMSAALAIARQIAEALEAAHEKGVIHRDLKPANIKVTPDGTVKVLDFGLATVVERSPSQNINATHSPTLTLATQAGVILGTAAYMSPEQASGAIADRRADVWAFGVVLWEMLAGTRLFDGETVSHTLAYVLTKEPDWSALPPNTQPSIRRLLRRCLEKDRKKRLADITSARIEIDDAVSAPGADVSLMSAATTAPRARHDFLPWVLAAVAIIVCGVTLALWAPWRTSAKPAIRLTSDTGADALLTYSATGGPAIALSPNGELAVFSAQSASGAAQLYVRRLDQLVATLLMGTEDARNPFFSPDGQWIGFFANGKLKKISVTGGAAVVLCDASNGRGGTWTSDGAIVFQPSPTSGQGLMRVSDTGGTPEVFVKFGGNATSERWPQMLPQGKALLFTEGGPGYWDDANIVVQSPDGARKIVARGGYYGRYVSSGHILYIHGGTLFALPFDLKRLEPTGSAVPVQAGVAATVGTGSAQFAASDTGTFVYLPGDTATNEAPIVFMDRDGRTSPLRPMPSDWSNPKFSPDGTRLAMDLVGTSGVPAVWIYDWTRDTPTRLTTSSGIDVIPIWTPDGSRIVFSSTRDKAVPNLYWQRSDGSGDAQRLTTSDAAQLAGTWHPGGRLFAFRQANPQTGLDIMILPIEGNEASGWKPGQPTPFLNTAFDEQMPSFSPDGHWLAYVSNDTGQPEVYVRPFPASGSSNGRWTVSNGGALYPIWSKKRQELFYSAFNSELMVASYTVRGDSIQFDKPRRWSPRQFMVRPRLLSYDLHPDGDRFAVAVLPQAGAGAKPEKIVFVFNFFDELKRLAPAKQ
jgi:serine/threonine protein kinase/Tol biopolymer transport system component